MGKIPRQIGNSSLGILLGLLSAGLLYFVFRNTGAVHSHSPILFVAVSGLVTAICGLTITWLCTKNSFEFPISFGWLGLSLLLGYAGLAWQHVNSGYFIWLGIPLMFAMQGLITAVFFKVGLWRGLLAPAIMTLVFLAGNYVSVHRADFGVTNEYYFTYLIFLYPHLSILVSLVGRQDSGSSVGLDS